MIKDDKQRDMANKHYDDMDHVEWEPPDKLRKQGWFRSDPSTDPHDAIATGVRVLSALKEGITLQPLASNPETKTKANQNEKTLGWIMDQVNKRRQGTVQKSVVRSALKYDEVCAQVIDLDFQIKNKDVFGGDTKREKAARRYGRFVVNTYHPNDVHVLHSNYMPEAVLLVQTRTAKDVMKEWGKLASGLKKAADNDEKVKYWDYMDYDDHVVWASSESDTGQEKNPVVIMKEEHDLPFLPWVARVGGDVMEAKPEHRRRPLLYSINQAGSWYTLNIVKSISTSEIISYAAAPRFKEEGPMNIESRSTEVDYGDINKKIDVTPGDTLEPIPPPGLDPSLREAMAGKQAEMAKSTVANILQGGDVAPGTAFASLNLQTQTAVGALKPGKELAEYSLSDIYTLFLLWANYTESDIKGYGTGKEDLGQEYTIRWNEIDPANIYLSVELKPDVPLDRMQKANVAMLMVQAGIYSKERAMEDMGITDPDAVTKEMFFERMTEAQFQNIIDSMAMQNQLAVQQQQMAMQQEQQMGLEAMQNEMAGAPGGQGFNPALGGGPPQEAAPGATREGVTGEDMMGNEAPFGMGGF
jgi:hypothetical protein